MPRRITRVPARRLLFLAGVVAVLMAAISCSSGSEPTATSVPPTATTPSTQPTATTAAPTATAMTNATATAKPTNTSPTATAPAAMTPSGTLNIAVNVSGSQPLGGLQSANGAGETLMKWGVAETFFMPQGDDPAAGMLVDSWSVEPDLSGATLHLKQGVMFHDGYGEFTAEDAAWNINDANAGTNPTSIHGQAGDFNALFGDNPWQAIDKYTIQLKFSQFDSRWASRQLNLSAEAIGISSKAAYDKNGEEWDKENFVGTGPYEITDQQPGTKVIVEAVPDQWRTTPHVETINYIWITEPSARVAALKTHEVDVATQIAFKDVKSLTSDGTFDSISSGGRAEEIGVVFAGNLWEKTDPEGNALDRPGFTPDDAHPWIGNPDDSASMESAKKVRTALAMAIDRDLINKQVLGGLGYPAYDFMFSPKSPHWQDKWTINYDPEAAKQMLQDAGHPASSITMDIYMGAAASYYLDLAEAVGTMWRNLGINVTVSKEDYSVWRPTAVQRSQNEPFLKTCGESISTQPWDWPKGLTLSSLSRGGFACVVESPFITDHFLQVSKEPDMQKRIALNNEVAQYMFDQQLVADLDGVPTLLVVNPGKIESWSMPPLIQGDFFFPENIVLK